MRCLSKEPFTYYDRMAEDYDHMHQWAQYMWNCVQDLLKASYHELFPVFAQQYDLQTEEQLIDPETVVANLGAWYAWLAEQDKCA